MPHLSCFHKTWPWSSKEQAAAEAEGEEPLPGVEDADYFRRLNNSRKSRADKFLKHPLARYRLLATISVATILAPISRLLFALHEVRDQEKQRESSKTTKRARMRQRLKGPEAFIDLTRDAPLFIADIAKAVHKAIGHLWDGDVFDICREFWPSSHSKSEMFESLCEERMLNIAQLKWRMMAKFQVQPYKVSWMDRYTSLDEVPADAFQTALDEFCNMKECCLDPHWAAQAQKSVLQSSDRASSYFNIIKDFFKNFRPTSLNEEKKHSVQRKAAGGFLCQGNQRCATSCPVCSRRDGKHLCLQRR